MKGHHQLQPEALAQRMLDHQLIEFTDDRARLTQGETRLDAVFQRDQPRLLQSHRFAACPVQVGELLERRTPPERERPVDEGHDRFRRSGSDGIGDQELELRGVDRVGRPARARSRAHEQ